MSLYYDADCGHSVQIGMECQTCRYEQQNNKIEELENECKKLKEINKNICKMLNEEECDNMRLRNKIEDLERTINERPNEATRVIILGFQGPILDFLISNIEPKTVLTLSNPVECSIAAVEAYRLPVKNGCVSI